jgi:hypothetical protein
MQSTSTTNVSGAPSRFEQLEAVAAQTRGGDGPLPVRYNPQTRAWEVLKSSPAQEAASPGFVQRCRQAWGASVEAGKKKALQERMEGLNGFIQSLETEVLQELMSDRPIKRDSVPIELMVSAGLEADLRELGLSEGEIGGAIRQLGQKFARLHGLSEILSRSVEALDKPVSAAAKGRMLDALTAPDYGAAVARANKAVEEATDLGAVATAMEAKVSALRGLRAIEMRDGAEWRPTGDRFIGAALPLAEVQGIDRELLRNVPREQRELVGTRVFFKQFLVNAINAGRPNPGQLQRIQRQIEGAESVDAIEKILKANFFVLAQAGIFECFGAWKSLGQTQVEPTPDCKPTFDAALGEIGRFDTEKHSVLEEISADFAGLDQRTAQEVDPNLAAFDAIQKTRKALVDHAAAFVQRDQAALDRDKQEWEQIDQQQRADDRSFRESSTKYWDTHRMKEATVKGIQSLEARERDICAGRVRGSTSEIAKEIRQERRALAQLQQTLNQEYSFYTSAQQRLEETNRIHVQAQTRLRPREFASRQGAIDLLRGQLESVAPIPEGQTQCQEQILSFKDREVEGRIAEAKAYASQPLYTRAERQFALDIASYLVVPAIGVVARVWLGW